MDAFTRLTRRLAVEEINPGQYHGGAGEAGVGGHNRLYGGLVAAQASMCAQKQHPTFPIHSLHLYFVGPSSPGKEIVYSVTTLKQGTNFEACTVTATQDTRVILQMQASFQREEPGVYHLAESSTPQSLPPPEELPNRDQLRGRKNWREMPIDVRMATEITGDTAAPPFQELWLKPAQPIPDDPHMHHAFLVYASDRSLLDTAWRPHAHKGQLAGASLDHIIWFHTPLRWDNWLQYSLQSPIAANSRGLAFGAFYDLQQQPIATVAQQGSLRYQPA